MNTSSKAPIDCSPFELDVRILAALTSVLCEHYQGLEVNPEETALADVAAGLAERVSHCFQHLPGYPEIIALSGIAGPLAASLQAAHDASCQAAGAQDNEDAMARLITRACCWSQLARVISLAMASSLSCAPAAWQEASCAACRLAASGPAMPLRAMISG